MKPEQIPVQVGITSLVGVTTQFPRGNGNYVSTWDQKTQTTYEIVNLSCEDLEDAIRLGMINTSTMLAEVYDTDNENVKVAYVIDERFPKICLTPEWFYNSRHSKKVPILRRKYNVPEGACLCEFDESHEAGIHCSSFHYNEIPGYIVIRGSCCECKKEYRIVKRRNK